jgi:ABC-2 type transport system ATP-binding protein
LFSVDTSELDGALRELMSVGVRSLVSQPPTLEEVFLQHYQQSDFAAQASEQASQ